ncbi:septum formation initiator family protein [Moraxella sp. ZJ142]|uniref:FtsB family cell division protein n=1 Tax=Moraxella marmotae TaxID=3344520 RepID=UPI0035D500F7
MANITKSLVRMTAGKFGYALAIVLATMMLLLLSYQYWYGEYGHNNLLSIKDKLQEQIKLNEEQAYKNSILLADVKDLKSGLSAIEEHARLDLGLIKRGETFIQLSNAPIVYSHQPMPKVEEEIESVDMLPEPVTVD